MTRSALERYAGSLAVTNADLGARLALQVSIETLRELGHDEAAEVLEEIGERQVARAFAMLSWEEPEAKGSPFTPYAFSWPDDPDLPADGDASAVPQQPTTTGKDHG